MKEAMNLLGAIDSGAFDFEIVIVVSIICLTIILFKQLTEKNQ